MLNYADSNSKKRYTPDVLVHYKPSLNKIPCVFEVKMSDEIKEKKVFFEEKFNQIEKYINLNQLSIYPYKLKRKMNDLPDEESCKTYEKFFRGE